MFVTPGGRIHWAAISLVDDFSLPAIDLIFESIGHESTGEGIQEGDVLAENSNCELANRDTP